MPLSKILSTSLASGAGGKVKQWITNTSLTNVNSTSAGTTKQSLGSIGPITPTSNSSTIYVIHNMFVLPYHTSGTGPQLGVGFEKVINFVYSNKRTAENICIQQRPRKLLQIGDEQNGEDE